jgi:uncharacterized repeat protein (TIGR03806 family)
MRKNSIAAHLYMRVAILMVSGFIFAMSCKKDPDDPGTVLSPFVFEDSLSSYDFFTGDMKDLQPAADVFPYELSTPLFSDHTIKHRFIKLPAGKSMAYRSSGIVDFPAGTIIIKNFSSLNLSGGEKRIETRLLVLDPYDNKWKVMVYLWNDAETEAVKHITGKNLSIRVEDELGVPMTTNYKVPNTNDCKGCHINNSVVIPIGPKIRSLNFTPSFSSVNQLQDWATKGLLTGLPASGVPKLPVWDDELNFTLNERSRAYLDMNCAHCHMNGGAASYTGYWLDYDVTDSSKLGIRKAPVAAGPGSGTLNFDVVPGHADSSIVIFRMNSTTPAIAMPELARSVIHEKGVQLIREWIDSL